MGNNIVQSWGLIFATASVTLGDNLCSRRGGMGLCDNKLWSLWVEDKRNIRLRRSYLEGVKIVISSLSFWINVITLNLCVFDEFLPFCTNSPLSLLFSFLSLGIPASSGNSLDSLQDDNPPHWLKSLQALTEMDGPSAAPSQTHHSAPFSTQIPLHRASWNPYPPPSNPSSFHSPPPGFQTAFRPPSKTPTDLLQSSTLDRH